MFVKFLTTCCIAALFIFAGCSNNPSSDNLPTDNEFDLQSEFGGYTAISESFAFDDPILISESSDDVDYGDPMYGSAAFDSLVDDPESGHYHMRIVWGQLRYDSTHTDITDWTGSLSVNRGGEVIRRLIHWELNQDFIIPRTDRKLIEWISKTTVHNDGIVVDLFIPPVLPIFDTSYVWDIDINGDSVEVMVIDTTIPDIEPVEVTFATGPYTRTFSLEELNTLDTIVRLDNSNAVAFHALKINHRECPAGFFNGFWGYNEEGKGVFRGMWISKEGFVTGFVKGHFGVNNEGNNVLFGKYISRSGRFEGFIKGTYESSPDDTNDPTKTTGMFQARIFNADRIAIGALEGKYRSGEYWEGGFMQGRWKIRCRENINDNDDSANDGL